MSSVVEKVAKAIYESYRFKRPWDDEKAIRTHAEHTRRAARAAIRAYKRHLAELESPPE